MTRKKFRIFMITFIAVSISVLSGFMINNFNKKNNLSSAPTHNEVMSEGMTDNNYSPSDAIENVKFYVNENSVKKTKTISNETTLFTIESKLFLTNTSSKTATIDPDAFSLNYDTEGTGLLYNIDYGNIEKPVILQAGESTSITFIVSYIITDTDKFIISKKRNLNFNYLDKQILVCLV